MLHKYSLLLIMIKQSVDYSKSNLESVRMLCGVVPFSVKATLFCMQRFQDFLESCCVVRFHPVFVRLTGN